MGLLKSIAQIKPSNNTETISDENAFEAERKTYHEDGFNTSKTCQGRPENLAASMEAIYNRYENKCREQELEQNKLKHPYITELKGKQTFIITRKEELERQQERLAATETQIENLRSDIIGVRRDPGAYGISADRRSTSKFWIGLLLLAFLTVYILIFYISTSFSAFFRTFNPSTELFSGMFYPQALQEAYDAGALELGFILFIPFVFFGLGYLIHMFWHKKSTINVLKVLLLFITTFIFDALLAYLIDEKLYNLDKTFEDPIYSVGIAFSSPSFWVIIFAGFVSYAIWGLVFDMVMKEHADRDKIQNYIATLEKEIRNILPKREKHKEEIHAIEKGIDEVKVRCSELENIIDGFILPIRNYKALSSEYLQGWMECVSSLIAMGHEETRQYLNACREVYDKHIKKLDLDTDTYQNKVYTKSL
ncbi:ABC transporter permease [Muriicola sp. Z0-33]|uniref:ABC transporter permease n=1 Tax=Muriicola sp. Z0-33 TaxID=2816957 RepID=UPI002237ADB6|nr:ABC transporter permease [Muriicola sp. Z0-33]MCW5516924.1 APC family permease [Muriicola sp. Z0-33]